MGYRLAKGVQEVARDLIVEEHAHLLGVRVTCVFVDKIPTSKGRQVWARAKKISGLNAFLADENGLDSEYSDQPPDFFVLEVTEEVWRKLSEAARKALVDEQLCSMEFEEDEETGSVSLAVVGPDVSGWRDVVKRHGLWREDLEEFVRAGAEQLTLDAVDETGGVAEEGEEERENLDVSITHNGRTAHTNTETLNKLAAGEMTVVRGGRSS